MTLRQSPSSTGVSTTVFLQSTSDHSRARERPVTSGQSPDEEEAAAMGFMLEMQDEDVEMQRPDGEEASATGSMLKTEDGDVVMQSSGGAGTHASGGGSGATYMPATYVAAAMGLMLETQDAEVKLQQAFATQEQEWFAAICHNGPDGKPEGLLASIYQSNLDVAHQRAIEVDSDAWKGVASAGMTAGSFGVMAGSSVYAGKEAQPHQEKLTDAQALEASFKSPSKTIATIQGEPGETPAPGTPAVNESAQKTAYKEKVQARAKEMAKGDIDNYRALNEDGQCSIYDLNAKKQLNEDAVEYLKTNADKKDVAKFQKALNKKLENEQGNVSSAHQRHQTRLNCYVQPGAQGLTQIAGTAFDLRMKDPAVVAEGYANAQVGVNQLVGGQLGEAAKDCEQKAQQVKQQEDAIVNALKALAQAS